MGPNFRENLFKFISTYLQQYGCSPSYSEMTTAMEISPKSKSLITRTLRVLEKEGKIALKKDGRRLLIALREKGLPILGRISAGVPIEALAECEFVDVNNLFPGVNNFALKIKGNSMIDEGILDGDIIICRNTNVAQEGDIVVALIDHQNTTLKRISFKTPGFITLVPANLELKPLTYKPERIHIQGIYKGLIRACL